MLIRSRSPSHPSLTGTARLTCHRYAFAITAEEPPTPSSNSNSNSPATYRIRLVPHLETYRSVHFEPVVRDLKPCDDSDNLTGRGTVVKIGRFTERAQQAQETSASAGVAQSETISTFGAWGGAGAGGDVTAPSARDTAGDFGGQARMVNGANASGTGTTGAGGGGALTSNKVAFRSKVVSRAHAEFWVEAGGQVRRCSP